MENKPVTPRRLALALGAVIVVGCVVAGLSPLIGSARVDLGRAFEGLSPDREIFFYARLPRVLLSLLVGGALSVAGVLFQALVRDALADPYTLGVSSGASLGAVLSIWLGVRMVAGLPGLSVGAFAGAALTLLLVMAIASRGRRMSSFTLLLAGVTINSIAMAVILLLHNLADFGQSFAMTRWLMGGIDVSEYSTIGWLAAVVVLVTVFLFWRARDWNLLAVGEEWAEARGASLGRMVRAGFLAGSLLTGAVTALTGPIGFIGLMVPHALRLRLGADHRLLIPCSFFAGASFLGVCDTAARTVLAPTEIPVGVITAILGGPFFIWLLRSRRRSLWL